ncbi:MAG: CHAP domain-containing protein, partial [Pseudonocardiales bacterium]
STALGVGPRGHCANGWRTEQWCADFATWVWQHAGANTSGLNPGAISFKNYGVRHGTWHTGSPRVGDAVVFNVSGGSASHVGLVVSASGNSFVMISGNTRNPNTGRDDIVGRANRTAGSGGVSGFASPVG